MTIKELRLERGRIAEEMGRLAENLTPENLTKFDRLDAEQKALKAKIDRAERFSEVDAELRSPNGRKPAEPPIPGDTREDQQERRYHAAWNSFIKNGWAPDVNHGLPGVSDEERSQLAPRLKAVNAENRDMGTGGQGAFPGATSGFLVPVGFVNKVEEALKYYGPMWDTSETFPTATGQVLPYPTDNDTTVEGEIVGEGQQVTTADVAVSMINFGAYKFSSKLVKVSLELLQDSQFDLEKYLVDKFAKRIGRISNRVFTVGTGIGQPKGIVPSAALSGQTVIGNDNLSAPDPRVQVGYVDLVNLEHGLDIAYRNGAKYMFHDTTLRYLKTLKDGYGRPLWTPGMATKAPDTINGFEFAVNNHMDQLATGNTTVLFGQLSKYMIRKVKDMAVLRLSERYADFGQVAFIAFARYDGALLDAGTHPVVALKQS